MPAQWKNPLPGAMKGEDAPVLRKVFNSLERSLEQSAQSAAQSAMPVGVILDFGGAVAPAGWLLCFGQAVNRLTFAALFASFGTTFGVGDGVTTFNLPDYRGRVGAGLDNMGGNDAGRLTLANVRGTVAGTQTHTLSTAELASHNHTQNPHLHGPGGGSNSFLVEGVGLGVNFGPSHTGVNTTANATATNNAAGSGEPHNIMQPTILVNKIVKT